MSNLTTKEREALASVLGCEFHDGDYGECAACASHAEQVWDDGLAAIVTEREVRAAQSALWQAAEDFERIAGVKGTFFKGFVLDRLRDRSLALTAEAAS